MTLTSFRFYILTKNPNGSFYEMHYEGELWPENVLIIRYDAYDFEERRSDSNVHDKWYMVTSIHPNFFRVI